MLTKIFLAIMMKNKEHTKYSKNSTFNLRMNRQKLISDVALSALYFVESDMPIK